MRFGEREVRGRRVPAVLGRNVATAHSPRRYWPRFRRPTPAPEVARIRSSTISLAFGAAGICSRMVYLLPAVKIVGFAVDTMPITRSPLMSSSRSRCWGRCRFLGPRPPVERIRGGDAGILEDRDAQCPLSDVSLTVTVFAPPAMFSA